MLQEAVNARLKEKQRNYLLFKQNLANSLFDDKHSIIINFVI